MKSVLPIDNRNRDQTDEPLEADSGDRLWICVRYALAPGVFRIRDRSECVNDRSSLMLDSLAVWSARPNLKFLRIVTRFEPDMPLTRE